MARTQYTVPLVHLYQSAVNGPASSANRRHCSLSNWLKLLHLMVDEVFSHYTVHFNWINELIEVCRYGCTQGERSSAVEHSVHIGDVTGSIPVAPTTLRKYPSSTIDQQRIAGLRPESGSVFHPTS